MEDYTLFLIIAAPSLLSIILCIISLAFYFKHQNIRDIYEFKYVIMLIFIEAFSQIFNILPLFILQGFPDYCKFQGFTLQLLSSMEAIWVCVISLLIYRKYYLDLGSNSLNLKKCLVLALLASLPLEVVVIFADYNPNRFECNIGENDDILNFFIFHYLFTYNFIFIAAIFNSVLVWRFNQKLSSLKINHNDRAIVNLLSYPYIMLLGYLPYFFLRCLQLSHNDPGIAYQIICAYFSRLIGFIYSLLFLSNRKFRRALSFIPGRPVDLKEFI